MSEETEDPNMDQSFEYDIYPALCTSCLGTGDWIDDQQEGPLSFV